MASLKRLRAFAPPDYIPKNKLFIAVEPKELTSKTLNDLNLDGKITVASLQGDKFMFEIAPDCKFKADPELSILNSQESHNVYELSFQEDENGELKVASIEWMDRMRPKMSALVLGRV